MMRMMDVVGVTKVHDINGIDPAMALLYGIAIIRLYVRKRALLA